MELRGAVIRLLVGAVVVGAAPEDREMVVGAAGLQLGAVIGLLQRLRARLPPGQVLEAVL